jgi:hypothetical protein
MHSRSVVWNGQATLLRLPKLLLLLLLLAGQFPIADSKRLCAYMIDSALDMLHHPQQQQQQDLPRDQQQQQQEQILWVVDLQGISMSKIDLAFVMFVLQAVPECYPRR